MTRTDPSPIAASRPDQIADRIVDAILAGRLAPGQRLGEQDLAALFGVSRTLVREALARLSARGMVTVNARRGWYVVQPSLAEAREAFGARVAIETGLLRTLDGPPSPAAVQRLKAHVAQEQAAIHDGEPGQRSWLLGDFHVCLADCLGNALLADILRDLTARTTLIATLYQSTHAAGTSCAEHGEIVAALEAGDIALAVQRLQAHIGSVAEHLDRAVRPPEDDPLAPLRAALGPLAITAQSPAAQAGTATRRRPRRALFTPLVGGDAAPATLPSSTKD
ncbi:GntR family transcriptional regulator [Ideonella sp. DXS22W]|uniref:GntR family transcriptional regulator n=1 Tax=Pseudaquabacterium inlustre TaxID=2984192 RepID=A0ABU9CER9_9BURK